MTKALSGPAPSRTVNGSVGRRFGLACLAAGLLAMQAAPSSGQASSGQASSGQVSSDAPKLMTHQQYLEDINRKTKLAVEDPMAVLDFVLNSLPDRVKVYPSENYYYFKFIHNGQTWAGNIRLDTSDRDEQVVHFAYFLEYTLWWKSPDTYYRKLTQNDGIKLEKLDKLLYRLTYKGRSVTFEINDLSNQKPPAGLVLPGEVFIGPTEDDSGMRFFLLFHTRLKLFLYVLNETGPVPETFYPVKISKQMIIGGRTGFVFYKDKRLDRKILIGVFEGNSMVNNYYDGPFDQLPDNFVQGDEMRKAVIAVDPSLDGKVDRFGADPKGDERFAVNPYIYYGTVDDLNIVEKCIDAKGGTRQYLTCFNLGMAHGGAGPSEAEIEAGKPKRRGR
jgi:hypothetical protein